MITNYDACRIVEEHRGDAVVVTAMNAGNWKFGWPAVTHREELDLPVTGAMGKASSVGLGLALAHPERKIIVLDGDGSLLMNLGTLVTIANKRPENLYHFVFENGVYAVTGGQPTPGSDGISFQNMAKDSGYVAAYEIEDTEDLATSVERILEEKGPVLICLKVQPEIENTPVQFRQRPKRNVYTAMEELPKALGH